MQMSHKRTLTLGLREGEGIFEGIELVLLGG